MSGPRGSIWLAAAWLMAMAAAARSAGPIGIAPEPQTVPPEYQPQIGINSGAAEGTDAAGKPTVPQEPEKTAILSKGTATAPAGKWTVGEPVGDMMSTIAIKFGVILVMPRTSAVVLKAGELPKTLGDAVAMARDSLEPQGLGLIESVTGKPDPRVVLKVTSLKEAKATEEEVGPVTSGDVAGVIDTKDPLQRVTHLLTLNNPDQLEVLERKAREDASVDVDVVNSADGGQTLIFRGPAAKVKTAVTAVAALDKAPDTTPVVRQLKLAHLDAMGTAATLNARFDRQGGGQLRAVGDKRTNMVVISGPEDQVVDAMVSLVEMDLDAGGGKRTEAGGAPGEGSPAAPGESPGAGR